VRSIRRRELLGDRAHVVANGSLADAELLTDTPIRLAPRHVHEDFELPIG
jgi:hypothetical protein